MATLRQVILLAICVVGSCDPTCPTAGSTLMQTKHQTVAAKTSADDQVCWGKPDPQQQLNGEILQSICAKLHDHATNFLVFGLGRDSSFWYNNSLGKVIFLENHADWVKFQSDEVKRATRIVQYTTDTANYTNVLKDEAKLSELLNSLPGEVHETHWDVILVDSPMGMEDRSGKPLPGLPGRMQSIYAAGQLAHAKTTIYVDDYHRQVEKDSVEALLVPKRWRVAKVHSSGHTAGTRVGETVELLFVPS